MLAHRRVFYLSSEMELDATKNDKYRKTIRVPRFDEEYNHVSILSASIPNSFYTIQEDVNDVIIIHFETRAFIFNYPYSIRIKIPEGFYTDEEILKIINTRICSVKVKDIFNNSVLTSIFDKEDLVIQPGSGFIFENEDCKKMKFVLNSNAYYFYDDISGEDVRAFITGIRIESQGLAYRYLGLPITNYSIFKDASFPDPDKTSWPIKTKNSFSNDLPARPSLIWVSSLQIRLDIINQSEDSQVLINIPIPDLKADYITFQNNQVELTAKKISATPTQGQITISITQQNGYELNLQDLEYSFDIILFKSEK